MGYQATPQKQEESKTLAHTSNGLTSTLSGMGGSFSLPRQASIYSLTLDEFQNVLGESSKQFGSMNMDELLKNIWTAEESQAMAAAMGAHTSLARQQSLQRQEGSLSLPRTISRKTVDEVWRQIQRENDEQLDAPLGDDQRYPTFGEMTLEDFLVKAGVVREDLNIQEQPFALIVSSEADAKSREPGLPSLSLSAGTALPGQGPIEEIRFNPAKHVSPVPQQTDWITNQYGNTIDQQQQQHILQQQVVEAATSPYGNAPKRVGNGALMVPDVGAIGGLGRVAGGLGGVAATGLQSGYGRGFVPTALGLGPGSPTSPLSDEVGPSHGDLSTPHPYLLEGTLRGRKRGLDGSVEKVLERRQKRMIKNRESAARSRARKQAYTVEMEAEVTRLKEENMRLQKQQEKLVNERKKQILDMMASLAWPHATKIQAIRRTRTWPC